MGKNIINSLTKETITKPDPIDEEVIYDGKPMLTETNTAGIITYVNRKFCEMADYSKEELIGSSHSITRHEDMPSLAFTNMWTVIKQGKEWHGYVKNLRKDGKYYWADVYIKAKLDENNNICGYIASRKPVSKRNLEEVEKMYKQMIIDEKK